MMPLFFETGIDARGFDRGLAGLRNKAGAFGSSLMSVLGTATAAFGTLAGVGALGAQFVQAGAQMETFETRLSTLMGSSDAAKERLGELYAFAASTPFELDQVVAAETTLRGFGAAADEVLPGLIDFAATTGADLSQSAIDIGKAWNQGAVGLESDAGRVLRKQIELTAGVDATTLSLEDFRAAMLDTLGNGMFAGGAERLSRTFSGMVSNLSDEWSGFKRQVADAGLFDVVKDALGDTLDLIKDNRVEVGELASAVSDGLTGAFKGTAYAVALVVDGVKGIRLGLEIATIGATTLGDALLTATEPLRQMMILASDGLGMDQATGLLLRVDSALGGIRTSLRGTREESAAWIDGLAGSTSALDTVRAIFADVEASAEATATDTGAATGGAGGIGDGGVGPSDSAYAQAVEDAVAFAAEIRAINQDAFTAERMDRDRLLEEAKVYYDLQITDLATFTAQREAIITASADRMFQLDVAVARQERRHHEEVLAQIEEEERARRAMMVAGLSTAQGIFGSISSVIDSYLEDSKRAQKRWALASILIDTAVGVAKAFAQFGWPAGLGPAAEVTAQGIAQGIVVAKQHQGGVMMGGAAPDEYDAGGVRRLRQEMTVTLPTHLTRAVDGLSSALMGGGGGAVELRIGREMQRELYREGQRTGVFGAAVQSVTSTGAAPGWTGTRALA